MSKKREVVAGEDDELEQQIDLTILLAHSSKIDENVQQAEFEANRQAAMVDFGLVEPGKASAKASAKPDQKLQSEVDRLTTELQLAEQRNTELNEQLTLNEESIVDLQKSVTDRDEQIARLTEQLQAFENGQTKPNLPAAVTEPNPFADGE